MDISAKDSGQGGQKEIADSILGGNDYKQELRVWHGLVWDWINISNMWGLWIMCTESKCPTTALFGPKTKILMRRKWNHMQYGSAANIILIALVLSHWIWLNCDIVMIGELVGRKHMWARNASDEGHLFLPKIESQVIVLKTEEHPYPTPIKAHYYLYESKYKHQWKIYKCL